MLDGAALPVFVPLSRSRALTRAVLWSVPALLLGAATYTVYSRLHFVPTAVSNRIVDYAIAVAAFPLPLLAAYCAVRVGAYLGAFAWPVPIGLFADTERISLRLGPFGTREYSTLELDIRYPFELDDEEEGSGFEKFLPLNQQLETMLPRIRHPAIAIPLNRTMLRFLGGDEREIAGRLRPLLQIWRSKIAKRPPEGMA